MEGICIGEHRKASRGKRCVPNRRGSELEDGKTRIWATPPTFGGRAASLLYVMYCAMLFEWDAEKNRTNQTKHSGLDFETASRVFADPDLILRKDRVIDGEQRWHALGTVRKAVLLVVHVYIEEEPHGEETVRIISAREANPRERRIYLEQAID
jgi:uncharacterized protein